MLRPYDGTRVGRFLRGASFRDARPYGNSGNGCPCKNRNVALAHMAVQAGTTESGAQLEAMALLLFRWPSFRDIRSFSSQVVANWRQFIRCHLAISLVGAITLVTFFAAPAQAVDVTDLTITNGIRLKERLPPAGKNRNLDAAMNYFADRDLKVSLEGLTEIGFRVVDTKDYYDLFFIPFAGPNPKGEEHPLILSATGPKGNNVLLGTVSSDSKGIPEVKEEKVVVEGKVEPGKGSLNRFFRCAGIGCVPAGLGCVRGGPGWLPCFCLWCGGSAIACGLNELFAQ